MLTSLTEILTKADLGGYAVIAPDFPSLLIARHLLARAEERAAPLILSYSTSFKPMCDLLSYPRFIETVRREAESVRVPVALHLDHAARLEEIAEAVDLGFTSVMIDASFEPYEVNVERALQTLKIARPAGVSVEAELGHVPSGEDYLTGKDERHLLTDVDQAAAFVEATQIDALAVAIGSVHGPYRMEPNLDFERLHALDCRISIPLVLHGSSGLGAANLRKSIALGIRKINVYSDFIRKLLEETHQELSVQRSDPLKVASRQARVVYQVLDEYIEYSGSAGKA